MKDRRALDMVEADVAQKSIYLQVIIFVTFREYSSDYLDLFHINFPDYGSNLWCLVGLPRWVFSPNFLLEILKNIQNINLKSLILFNSGRRPPFLVCQIGSLLYGTLICAASFLFVGNNVYNFLAPAELCFGLFSGIMVG